MAPFWERSTENVDYDSSSNSINCDFVFCGSLYYWSSEEEKPRRRFG